LKFYTSPKNFIGLPPNKFLATPLVNVLTTILSHHPIGRQYRLPGRRCSNRDGYSPAVDWGVYLGRVRSMSHVVRVSVFKVKYLGNYRKWEVNYYWEPIGKWAVRIDW